jgi:hypothetical protein
VGRAEIREEIRKRVHKRIFISLEEWREIAREHFEGYYGRRARLAVSEMNRIAGRVMEAAAEAFCIRLLPFELPAFPPPAFHGQADLADPVPVLDPEEWMIPLLSRFWPRAWVLRRALRREKDSIGRLLTRSLYKVDEGYILWLDEATRRLTEALRDRLEGLRQEILDALAQGRREREDGEAAVALRLASLDGQQGALGDLLRLYSPAER